MSILLDTDQPWESFPSFFSIDSEWVWHAIRMQSGQLGRSGFASSLVSCPGLGFNNALMRGANVWRDASTGAASSARSSRSNEQCSCFCVFRSLLQLQLGLAADDIRQKPSDLPVTRSTPLCRLAAVVCRSYRAERGGIRLTGPRLSCAHWRNKNSKPHLPRRLELSARLLSPVAFFDGLPSCSSHLDQQKHCARSFGLVLLRGPSPQRLLDIPANPYPLSTPGHIRLLHARPLRTRLGFLAMERRLPRSNGEGSIIASCNMQPDRRINPLKPAPIHHLVF